jgi:hypothetical protein
MNYYQELTYAGSNKGKCFALNAGRYISCYDTNVSKSVHRIGIYRDTIKDITEDTHIFQSGPLLSFGEEIVEVIELVKRKRA